MKWLSVDIGDIKFKGDLNAYCHRHVYIKFCLRVFNLGDLYRIRQIAKLN